MLIMQHVSKRRFEMDARSAAKMRKRSVFFFVGAFAAGLSQVLPALWIVPLGFLLIGSVLLFVGRKRPSKRRKKDDF